MITGDLRLLEVAIGDIVVAPVRHSVKLNGVRKFHLVFFIDEAFKFLDPFVPATLLAALSSDSASESIRR